MEEVVDIRLANVLRTEVVRRNVCAKRVVVGDAAGLVEVLGRVPPVDEHLLSVGVRRVLQERRVRLRARGVCAVGVPLGWGCCARISFC
jgi:hypothetical protein